MRNGKIGEFRFTTVTRFFFSSRRRHTRWTGDWSSDVCSSDLTTPPEHPPMRIPHPLRALTLALVLGAAAPAANAAASLYIVQARSTAAARASVLRVHGTIQSDLSIIHAVAARLDAQQSARLRATSGVRLFEDRKVAARSLLSGLTQTLSQTTNSLDQTLATNPLVSTVTSTAVPLVTTVTGNSLTGAV